MFEILVDFGRQVETEGEVMKITDGLDELLGENTYQVHVKEIIPLFTENGTQVDSSIMKPVTKEVLLSAIAAKPVVKVPIKTAL